MSDLIDRQAVIDAVGDWIYNPEDLRYHKDVINSIPAVQPDHTADIGKKAEGDCISRQAAIDLFPDDDLEYDTKGGYVAPHLARRMICELPSAQPEPHWIPCSKRLPEDGRRLVTRYDSVTNTCFSDILWYEKGVWWNRLCIGDFAVIAWMPLPEPYRGGDSE